MRLWYCVFLDPMKSRFACSKYFASILPRQRADGAVATMTGRLAADAFTGSLRTLYPLPTYSYFSLRLSVSLTSIAAGPPLRLPLPTLFSTAPHHIVDPSLQYLSLALHLPALAVGPLPDSVSPTLLDLSAASLQSSAVAVPLPAAAATACRSTTYHPKRQ